jgi:hypothetical protein
MVSTTEALEPQNPTIVIKKLLIFFVYFVLSWKIRCGGGAIDIKV